MSQAPITCSCEQGPSASTAGWRRCFIEPMLGDPQGVTTGRPVIRLRSSAPGVLKTLPAADLTCSGAAFPVGAVAGIVMLI
jgi:hypothetical protein